MMEIRNSTVESSIIDPTQPMVVTQQVEGEGSKIQAADVAVSGGGGVGNGEVVEVVKRKRGRPPRVQANLPAAKKSKEEDEDEDVCFICFDGGSLVLCDRRGCPKAYHPACIKRDEAFFRSKAKWTCGWHICSICEKAAHHMCYTCTYSLCKGCIGKSEYLCVRGDKGFCTVCMQIIMLIEKSGDATAQVDFDDKTSWEYLFKVYWVYLKGKLSLTFDELTQAKNPWKLAPVEPAKPTGSHVSTIVRRSITSELSRANLEANESKRRKTNEQTNEPLSPKDPSMEGEPKEWANKELLDFVAHMKNGDTSVLSYSDVQTLLLDYINKNNLRDPRKKSQIVCDLRLMNLFGKPRVGHIEMLKLLELQFLVKENPQKDTPTSTAKHGDSITDSKGEINVVTGGNKERRNHRRGEKRVTQNKLDEYAAIDMHNMNLIYLRRNMMESLIEDKEKFHEKAVGSIVQIRISGSDQKDDMYRLVQVVGTTKVDVPYKVRDKLVDFMLEVLNLDKKETVTIDTISNQELSEDKCRRLRESIRCGLVRCFTVGEIQEKALALQSVLLDDRIKTEMLQLNQLRDRASGNGQKKIVRECVQKLKILKTPEERAQRLREIPEIHCDPKMNPDYESDDTEEYFNNEHGDHLKPVLPWVGGTNTISPTKKVENLNDQPIEEDSSKSKMGKDAIELNDSGRPQNEADCNGSTVPKHNPEAAVASGSTPSFLSIMNNRSVDDNMWHYRDPSGNVQGPFSIVQLQRWSTSGYFPADMRIWAGQEADSLLLNNALQEHFDNYHGWRLENAACNSKGDNKVETVTVNSQKIPEVETVTVNSQKIPEDLNTVNESTGQSDIQNMPDINQRVSSTFSVVDVSLVSSPNQLPKKESLENQIIQKMPDLPSVASLSKSNSTVQFGIQKTPDINQHVSSVFNVSDAALVNIPSPLQKKENRKNKKKQDSALKEQSKLLVQDSGMRNMLDINQHVSSAFTVTDATPVDTPSPLQKKETRKTKKIQDSVMQNMPDINHHVSSTFNVVDAAHLKLPSPLPKKETRKNKKVPDSGFKEQSNFLVQDSKIHNMPDINQHAFSVFNVADAAVADLRSPLQKQESRDNKIIQDSGLKEQPKLLVHDSGIQHMPDINQRVSSAFNVPDAALVDLPSQLQKKEDRKIKNIHDYGLKEQSKLLVQDSGIQNMPDINQHVSSVFNVADVAHVDLRNPLQKKESRKNKNIQQSGLNEQSKFLVQGSGIKNMPDIKQHVSSVFTITDAAPVDLPSSSQKSGGNRKNQKIQDSGQKEHSKLLVQDSGIQYMPDINQHVSSAFTAAYASLVDLPSPLLKKESHENQSKEQSKVLAQDSGIQDMPDINQHVSSVFTVTDAALVDLPSPFPKKESRENQKIQDSRHMEQPKFLVQDSGNLPSWSTSLSLGHEWGSYPSTVDHQVATTNNNAIEQITHLPSWHGLGETIEFSTLAEESVSDLLAEVDAMESRNCVPSPTSRRNSFLEDLFNGSMDDFSPTADQGTRGGDGFSSTADIHLSRQSTGLQFSFGLEDKPICAVSIPQTSVSSNIGFKWAEMGSSELHPPRQDMIDLNDSTRAEVDDGERETVVEKKSTTRPITVAVPETRVGRKSKEKEGESLKAEKSFRGFSVVEEEEGEFIQPEAAPAPPSLPQPLPPLLPTPRGLPPSIGLDSVDLRRAGSGRPSQGTTSTGRVHAHTSGSSRSRNVERDSHHRRPGGDRYHSNSNSPRDRSHHVNDSGYSRSSKPSWSRQSSFGSGTSGGGSGYSRPTSKGQRVCRYFESGCCNKGSACTFLHPQER